MWPEVPKVSPTQKNHLTTFNYIVGKMNVFPSILDMISFLEIMPFPRIWENYICNSFCQVSLKINFVEVVQNFNFFKKGHIELQAEMIKKAIQNIFDCINFESLVPNTWEEYNPQILPIAVDLGRSKGPSLNDVTAEGKGGIKDFVTTVSKP